MNTAAASAPEKKSPPPKTRLYWSSLSAEEKAVLDAMYEHCSDGSIVWAGLKRIAKYAKLSRKTVQRALHGPETRPSPGERILLRVLGHLRQEREYVYGLLHFRAAGPENAAALVEATFEQLKAGRSRKRGLIARGIVLQLAKANPKGRKAPATYKINGDALLADPAMEQYRSYQLRLPGIRRRAVAGEPVEIFSGSESTTDPRSDVPRPQGPWCPDDYGPGGQGTTAPGSTDSVFDSLLDLDSQSSIHHACGAMSSHMNPDPQQPQLQTQPQPQPAKHDGRPTPQTWIAMKEMLRAEMSAAEWNLWVRPARFLMAMAVDTICVAVPPSSHIMAAATARAPLLRELRDRVGIGVVLTKYPDSWERERLSVTHPEVKPGGRT